MSVLPIRCTCLERLAQGGAELSFAAAIVREALTFAVDIQTAGDLFQMVLDLERLLNSHQSSVRGSLRVRLLASASGDPYHEVSRPGNGSRPRSGGRTFET